MFRLHLQEMTCLLIIPALAEVECKLLKGEKEELKFSSMKATKECWNLEQECIRDILNHKSLEKCSKLIKFLP